MIQLTSSGFVTKKLIWKLIVFYLAAIATEYTMQVSFYDDLMPWPPFEYGDYKVSKAYIAGLLVIVASGYMSLLLRDKASYWLFDKGAAPKLSSSIKLKIALILCFALLSGIINGVLIVNDWGETNQNYGLIIESLTVVFMAIVSLLAVYAASTLGAVLLVSTYSYSLDKRICRLEKQLNNEQTKLKEEETRTIENYNIGKRIEADLNDDIMDALFEKLDINIEDLKQDEDENEDNNFQKK